MSVVQILLVVVSAQILYENSTQQSRQFDTYAFDLPAFAVPFALIHLSVEPRSLTCLLLIGIERAPQAYMSENGDLQGNYEAADLTSFALGRSEAFVQLNIADHQPRTQLFLGVFLPSRSYQGVAVTLKALGHSNHHSDGELCPADCKQHGTCSAGTCQCEQPWVDQDCSLKVSYLELGQHYDLIIPPDSYRFFTTLFGQHSTLQLSLERLQSDSQLFVSFGHTNEPPTSLRHNSAQQINSLTTSLNLYFDPSTIGPFGLLFSFKTTDANTQAVVSLSFQQNGTTSSSSIYIILGAMLGGGLLCMSCFLVCLRCLCRRKRIRRQGARVHVYQNWSQSVEQEKILFEPSKVELDPTIPQDCVICLDVLNVSQPVSELPCKHMFHTACINAWFEKHNFCCVCKHIYEVARS